MFRCTFAGHREVGLPIADRIDEALDRILKRDTEFVFYSGGMGEFDSMCEMAVRRAKLKYPQLNIRLELVLPYPKRAMYTDKHLFDRIFIPDELEGVHYKRAIPLRNCWMADNSDYVISFIQHDSGGAFTTVSYAKGQGKEVVNIA